MHAAVLHSLGKTPRFEEFPDPIPGEGEVLLHVCAAALKPVDKQMAGGKHYASPREFPVVCGMDGVGRLEDGTRMFFGGPRRPYGTMAERTVVRRAQCFAIPEGVDDDTAAAIPNPGVSAWLSLKHSAKLASGETVLILGATGVTGKLAVQIAKILGAGRVVAAGRNEGVLSTLRELGADATIGLGKPHPELVETFRHEAGEKGFDVIIDYLWGPSDGSSSDCDHRNGICGCGIADSTGGGGRKRGTNNHTARCSAAQHGADDSGNRRHAVLGHTHRRVSTGNEPRSERQTAH